MPHLLYILCVRAEKVWRKESSGEEEKAGQKHVSKVSDLTGLSLAVNNINLQQAAFYIETENGYKKLSIAATTVILHTVHHFKFCTDPRQPMQPQRFFDNLIFCKLKICTFSHSYS